MLSYIKKSSTTDKVVLLFVAGLFAPACYLYLALGLSDETLMQIGLWLSR